ncbi:hypothetical protein ABT052_20575 [Streptomyces sp. NPDC002766]|jgi:hypothetical protein|uniref:hypothetical protein n=1 Tax=unclassified Streptomyces TaxID=2593676 RepID=UPI003325C9A4
MSEESTVPPQGGSTGRPTGLLQQMEELMAALNANLSALDAGPWSAGRGTADAEVQVRPGGPGSAC